MIFIELKLQDGSPVALNVNQIVAVIRSTTQGESVVTTADGMKLIVLGNQVDVLHSIRSQTPAIH